MRRHLILGLVAVLVTLASAGAFAEESAAKGSANVSETVVSKSSSNSSTSDKSVSENTSETSKSAQSEDPKKLIEEKNNTSKNGSYEFHRSFGVGAELGFWFSDLGRFGDDVFKKNSQSNKENFRHSGSPNDDGMSSIIGNWNLDIAAEATLLEGIRLTLFAGLQSPVISQPSSWALYGGLEPAFSFRRNRWEFATGLGVGFGGVKMQAPSSYKLKSSLKDQRKDFSANFVMLRPFLEVRYYFNHWFALYGRFGFNQWLVTSYASGGLTPADNTTQATHIHADSNLVRPKNLDEGQVYLSLGVRFGYYGDPVSVIGDRDGDGFKDDVDKCPDEPEDFDGFEDEDGCPDLDNDKDGIPDKEDKCPNEPEDKDGFEDEDGCPDLDNDKDGIPDKEDKCPNEPEDKDGFEDEDGCPDLDNDKDGIPDKVDKCPNEPEDKDGIGDEDGCPETDYDNDGVPDTEDKCPTVPGVAAKQGCPYEKVRVTLEQIQILDKVYFAYNKSTIQKKSYPLLDDVARTISAYPRIKKIEIAGHTDRQGSSVYNKKLSQQRAEAVLKYLVKRCVEPDRLVAVGYGETKPLVTADSNTDNTKEGLAENRRVEFNILEQDTVSKEVDEAKIEALKKSGQLSDVSQAQSSDGQAALKAKGSLESPMKKGKPCVFK